MIEEIFSRGAKLFNDPQYREAHEEWEALWIPMADSPRKAFIQGLIMIAVGLYKFERKEYAGTRKLFARGFGIVKNSLNGSPGMDADGFLNQLEKFWKKFETAPESIAEDDMPKIK